MACISAGLSWRQEIEKETEKPTVALPLFIGFCCLDPREEALASLDRAGSSILICRQ